MAIASACVFGADSDTTGRPKSPTLHFECLVRHSATLLASMIKILEKSAENWRRASRTQARMNARLETLRDIWQFSKRRQRNKPRATKSGAAVCASHGAYGHIYIYIYITTTKLYIYIYHYFFAKNMIPH